MRRDSVLSTRSASLGWALCLFGMPQGVSACYNKHLICNGKKHSDLSLERLSPHRAVTAQAGFSSAVPIPLDQSFHFPIRANSAAAEDASPKATTTIKAAASQHKDLQWKCEEKGAVKILSFFSSFFFLPFSIALQGTEKLTPVCSAVVFVEGHLELCTSSEFTLPGNLLVS